MAEDQARALAWTWQPELGIPRLQPWGGIKIQEREVTGDALHTMLLTRMPESEEDPTEYGFHSLRAGHVTQARRNGAPTEEIMRAGRWRNQDTVNIYDREHNPLARNSVTRLGL